MPLDFRKPISSADIRRCWSEVLDHVTDPDLQYPVCVTRYNRPVALIYGVKQPEQEEAHEATPATTE